jgi:hypothetical protein
MTITAKERAEMERVSSALHGAVLGLGDCRPIDVIGGCLGTIAVMADKLGQSPERALASLLLAVCDDDVRKAVQSVKLAAYERAAAEPEEGAAP